jgi:hypothetical protein
MRRFSIRIFGRRFLDRRFTGFVGRLLHRRRLTGQTRSFWYFSGLFDGWLFRLVRGFFHRRLLSCSTIESIRR